MHPKVTLPMSTSAEQCRDCIRVHAVELTVELKPADWSRSGDDDILGTPSWPTFWEAELRRWGLRPAFPGSWLVPVREFESGDALEKLVLLRLEGSGVRDFPDEDGEVDDDSERLLALAGGVCILAQEDEPLWAPGCCDDLSELQRWETLLSSKRASFTNGHGDLEISVDGAVVNVVSRHGADVQSRRVRREELQGLIAPLRQELEAFRSNIERFLGRLLTGEERPRGVARILTGGHPEDA
ncbi:MAG: hypothetical protein Q8Q09_23855 [Deltaproteobacteria bacterium]|nr:hypothetical protein [Deltaproteobacteria bacterium]